MSIAMYLGSGSHQTPPSPGDVDAGVAGAHDVLGSIVYVEQVKPPAWAE